MQKLHQALPISNGMTPDVTLGGALAKMFWFIGELAFKFVPGTVATIAGTDASGTGPILSGFSPIEEPVSVTGIVSFLENTSTPEKFSSFVHSWSVFVAISMFLSFILATGVIYCVIRIRQIRHIERMQLRAAEHTVAAEDIPKTQLRWNRVQEQAHSDSEQSWRLAILEADIMLNELLDLQGYRGETMADKMKQVDRAGFNTIDSAWEAHKIRNQVAHEGSGVVLNPREVKRVINLYESVFKEFKFIQ